MRLHRLEMTAFGPFGGRQDVDFDALSAAGLFLLHGPTGAGKTSVLDAVCYALYGAVPGARQSPGASLRSDHAAAGTHTEVLLELSVAGRRLEVTRRPAQPRPKKKGTGFTTEKAQSLLREYDAERAEWKALSRSHQEIGEEITQLVGMSREQFCQVVLLPQGDFARFLRADAEARGKLLGRLFDTRRFALVEERLAELRRGAEHQVRSGDEQLLAIAQRTAQAAGGAADGRPAPDARPGDPGLAESVLEWAAVARSGAREALDITGCALSAAESRQTAARRALDEARELARLQQRHAEATRRAAELAARRPARDRDQSLLDQDRKAELVGPALRLREDAERAHHSASAAWERARRTLPPQLVDVGAEQLAALERELRQELGGLGAARRAERRSAELARERAGLERQARADEDLLQDAHDWLSDWDSVRRRHQDRIAAATEAATRAERLAGRLDPARRRLAAARERDELATRVTAAEDAVRDALDHANALRATWLDLKERRLRGIAAELAAGLSPGTPCAVCGSPDHPAPATTTEDHVDRAREDAAYAGFTAADSARADAERELAVARESFAAARRAARELHRTEAAVPAPPASPQADRTTGGAPGTIPSQAEPASALAAARGSGPASADPHAEADPARSGSDHGTVGGAGPVAGRMPSSVVAAGARFGGAGGVESSDGAGEGRPVGGDGAEGPPAEAGSDPARSGSVHGTVGGAGPVVGWMPSSVVAAGARFGGAGGVESSDGAGEGRPVGGDGAEGPPAEAGSDPARSGSVHGTVGGAGPVVGWMPSSVVAAGARFGGAGGVESSDGAEGPPADGIRDVAGAERHASIPAQSDGGGHAEEAAADLEVGELRKLVEALEREHGEAHALAAGTHGAREALERAEREHAERLAALQEAEQRGAARTSRREVLDREQAAQDAEVDRATGGAGTVADRTALLERRIGLLATAADTVRAAEDTAQRLKEADDRLADAAFRAGFDTPAAAAAALLGDAGRRELQQRVDAWQHEAAAVADRLAEPDTLAAAERPPADPQTAQQAHDAADRALRDASSALAAARQRCAELARLSRQADAEVRRLGPLREEYDRIARLAGLTAGTSADNELRMRLESYVLAARLEQVAAAATVRLHRMSSGRYTLVHSDARAGGRRAGLGLHVVDAWTGRERDTATLSGGETFFASLALALGLADVVTDEAGGVRLDTLFIDEGFGSLDDQTLDEVLDVLDSLRERDRSVGIVSHVPDLRRRIPAQLEVVKDRNGSAVRLRTAGSGG
ncbi:AAA family ATPase [Streptomyces sp. NPDC007861]|uniref:AAA family ATPase n=1 Tax=Streptomyces sp. NPDC007861 TaxID=3154893 RepID=UPI0033E6A923